MHRSIIAAGVLLAACASRPAPRPVSVEVCSSLPPVVSPLELVVLGSGGPRSFGRAGASNLVRVAGVPRVLVDVGPGASVRLGAVGADLEALDTVLLTHLHVDHAGDVPGFVKSRDLSYRRPLRFRFFGPPGAGEYPSTTAFLDGLFGAHGVFRYLPGFRNALELDVQDVSAEAPVVLFEENGLRVSAVAVDHGDVPALAYRIDGAGRSLVVTGDLASKTQAIVTLAKGADVLVYDTAVPDPPAAPPILYELHTSPARIGEVAAAAGVGQLVLTHLTPSVERDADAVLQSIRRSTAIPVTFAQDCQRIPVR